jgi:D-3-phosphoglycerate dehydrogenase
MVGEEQIALMKPGARLVNCARGEIVDQEAVVRAVKEGRLAGAAFDVYTEEPLEDADFTQDDRILATPHLGASTQAAQEAVGAQAADQLVDALTEGHYRNALNITSVPPEDMDALRPLCDLVRKMGKMAGFLNRGRPAAIEVTCTGEVADRDVTPVVNYGVMGVLQSALGENINIVSAPHLAEERGIEVSGRSSTTSEAGFTNLLSICLTTDEGNMPIYGTVLGETHPRVVKVDEFDTEIEPAGDLLMLFTPDQPGVVGKVGEILGGAGINIAQMTFGRQEAGGEAMLALKLDSPCARDTLQRLRELEVVKNAVLISL